MERLGKKEFIEVYAKSNGITKEQSKREIAHFENAVKTAVEKVDTTLVLRGFLQVKKVMRKATRKFNPKTREMMDVPAKPTAKAKALFD
ncbi:HU family DNA-binding protein [Aerococcaceae bacterium zg-B36]|uniref:HU family DNA-binding protein n=1 Tax=Aerococcaceae bacterium zg-252 TaxID=2796928 RepID=UPI001BD8ACD0|nr:HU family DNA-binding protein [Aerococcaceae bacterium zg-B36]